MAKKSITKFCLILCIGLFSQISFAADKNDKNCALCHTVHLTGVHSKTACDKCHAKNSEHYDKSADFKSGAKGCLSCHKEYEGMLTSPMVTRKSEINYVHKAFDGVDVNFYQKNCANCHVTSCTDCHQDGEPHKIVKPTVKTCQNCHRNYYTGIEYSGLGQRDDHERYLRGKEQDGVRYASMLKDVHAEKGMQCSACHSMKSLALKEKSSKTCTDCHKVTKKSVEHSIPEHMEKMECWTCHAAWMNQEYGTFWIKFNNSPFEKHFRWVQRPNLEYAKSSHTKQYSEFPIGVNSRGKYSPIRPQFINFVTEITGKEVTGPENRMVSKDFKAVFPHTVRRGTVMCGSCHENSARLMRQKPDERIFYTEKDGLLVGGFFDGRYFSVLNGRFVSDAEYEKLTSKSREYKIKSVKKWDELLKMGTGGR